MLLLLALAGCDGADTVKARPGAVDDTAADTADTDDTDDTDLPPVDADADGYTADVDCADDDATIHPGAAEVCDGIDQDCDGEADDGVPNDGAGCADPGWPAFPDVVDVVHIALRTGDGTYAGTDDGGIEVCLGEELCFSPYKAEWNDLEPGVVDVTAHEGVDTPRAALDEVTVRATDGGDRWNLVGVEVALDGEVVHCRDLDVAIGEESDETMAHTEAFTVACDTVFDATLTHGPIVGAVGSDRARLWWRTDATRHVRLYVAEDADALVGAAPVHHAYPAADRDFTAVADVYGLAPDTTYAYALDVDGARYGPWSFRTAPEGATAARIAFGSCAKDDEQPVFATIRAWEPDIFVFAGDNHYANTGEVNGLRQFYRWAHARADRDALMASTSTLATWDDHDYVGNNTDGSAPDRDGALRVFEEYWANAHFGEAGVPGVFSRARWGDVELFLVDDRYYRGLDGTLLGAPQEAWLLDGLAASDATFKLVVSGSQFTPYGSSDSWASFPEDGERLRAALVDRRIEGVVLLSGDIHRFEVRALTPAEGGYTIPEITSSSLAYPTASSCGSDSSEPDRVACWDDGPGFVGLMLDTTAADPTFTATFYDEDGGVRGTWSTTRAALTLR